MAVVDRQGRGPGRPKEFERRYPLFLTKEQDDAIQEIVSEYDTTYSEAMRHLLNLGIRSRARNKRSQKSSTPR